MRTIVFIETNKSGSSREAIKAAERLGYFTVLLTKKENFINQRTEFPDVHQMILVEFTYNKLKETITNLQKQGKQIKCIVSFVHSYVYLAASLAEEFCPTVVSSDPIFIMENKILSRDLIADLPFSPYYAVYTPDDSLENFINKHKAHLPLIVKSPTSAGSRDVLLANDEKQLKLALQKLLKYHEQILLEEYLDGPQYLVEVLVHNNKVHIIAIIEQQITFFKRFIVTGYCLPRNNDKRLYDSILNTVTSILKVFQLKNGACHLEMRLVNGSWKLIEINPRISGGAMNRIIEIGYGINLVEETIQLMLGNEPYLTRKHSKYVYAHYLTVDSKGVLMKVTGRNRCSKYPGVEEVCIKPRKGQVLRPPLSMGDRYGYVIASSDVKEEAISTAKKAANEICFHLAPIEESE